VCERERERERERMMMDGWMMVHKRDFFFLGKNINHRSFVFFFFFLFLFLFLLLY